MLPTSTSIEFEWDDHKAALNLAKHRVPFVVAQEVWNDPLHIIEADRIEDGEPRWHALGKVGGVVILVAVHSHPDPDNELMVSIISARKATPYERKRYELGS